MTEADIQHIRKVCHDLLLEIEDDEDYKLLLEVLGKRRAEYLVRMLRDLPDQIEAGATLEPEEYYG